MISENRVGTRSKVSVCRLGMKSAIPGAGAAVLVLFLWASTAQAQCTSAGLTTPPPVWSKPAVAAVAGVSASVGSLVSSIHSVNTAFLTQSTAFIGSSADPHRTSRAAACGRAGSAAI